MDPEAITQAVYKAVESCILRRAKSRDIIDLDIMVCFQAETRTIDIEVFLDVENWVDADRIVEEAISDGMQLADKLMGKHE